MRIARSWLAEYADLPDPLSADALQAALIALGLEVDELSDGAAELTGPLVVGEVLEITELTDFKKPIRYCQVEVGEAGPRGIVCGARNFAVGDRVVVALPGSVLPGGFAIAARRTYGHVSDGMICSTRELGIGSEHDGILVLPADAPVGDDAVTVLGLDDVVVTLDITTDRGYCLSARGLARELAGGLRVPYRDPAADIDALPDGPAPYEVRVQDVAGCPRYVAAVVDGLDPAAATPAWMARRLTVAGIRAVSLAVDVTNYVMLELGQPLHAFDKDRLTGPIVVRRATPGERLQTLDGVVRDVHSDDLLITDDSGPIGLAAVMGGLSTEVTAATTSVLLEGAYWDPATVGRSARRHRLPSEASKRFERGTDPALPPVAVARAATLLAEYGGGRIVAGRSDVDHRVGRSVVRLGVDLPSRVVGVDYDRVTVIEALEAVGCIVTPDDGGDVLAVLPPSWRPDLVDPHDLVEEVVRREGYDGVPSVLPDLPAGSGLSPDQRRRRSVGRALAEAGYVETPAYPFLDAGVLDTLRLPEDDPRRRAVRIANPLSDAEPLMRTTLLPGLLRTLGRNRARGVREIAIFELGVVVRPTGQETGAPLLPVDRRPDPGEIQRVYDAVPAQPWHVGVVLSGERAPAGWWGAGQPLSWADAVQAARVVADAAGVQVGIRADQHAPWHPGRCAAVVLAGTDTVVGHAGELHPGVLADLELPARTCAMELRLSALPDAVVPTAPPLSSYPAALVDVALVVADDVPAAEVEAALASVTVVETARLFDVYAGVQVAAGHRSLAYALTLRSPDHTLTADEVTTARDAAVAAATQRTGATLRA